jgi:uncharacterized protein (DUF2141 family)
MRTAALAILTASTIASIARAADLDIEVSGIRDAAGALRVAVFAEANAGLFPDPDSMVAGVRIQLSTLTDPRSPIRVRIGGLRMGSYAVSAFHDADGNGILNRNVFGAPAEGYAFSRGARGRLGPPKFLDAAVELNETAKLIPLPLSY